MCFFWLLLLLIRSTAPRLKSLRHTKWHHTWWQGANVPTSLQRDLCEQPSLALGRLFILSYWWTMCFNQSWKYHKKLLSNCYDRSPFLWAWASKCATERSHKNSHSFFMNAYKFIFAQKERLGVIQICLQYWCSSSLSHSGCYKKATEQARGIKPINNTPLWSLCQVLLPGFCL